MSTRDTENRGFAAVAMTAIRYRCSAGLTSLFCHGCPVGTNSTSSSSKRSATSDAATRWPWWIGSKVPPITPIRRGCVTSGGTSAVLASSAERHQGDQQAEQDAEGNGTDAVAQGLVDLALGKDDGERAGHGRHPTGTQDDQRT